MTPLLENIEEYSSPVKDWEALIALANTHGILPLAYKVLKHSTHSPLPPEIGIQFKEHYLSIVQRNMLMSAELIRIIKLLEKHHIRSLAFKGPTLAQSAYQDITLRQFGDLDILIHPKDISKTIAILIKASYVPEIALEDGKENIYFKTLNVIGFHKDRSNIRIEVHWELLSKNYAIQWDTSALWTKKETVTINNHPIPVLPFEQQLLYLCVHGSKHLFERLEWICDIDRSIRTNPHIDWLSLMNEAKKMGIERMFYLGLSLCQYLFGLELPEMIRNKIEEDKTLPKLISKVIENSFSEKAGENKGYSSFGLLLSMREKHSDKIRFAWYAFSAPQFDDYTFVKLPRYFAFLYPAIRPYRLLSKYLNR